MSTPLWDKGTTTDDWVTRFTVGDDYRWDRRLLPYDVEATRAHAWGLRQIDVLSEEELKATQHALDDVLSAFDAGEVTVTPEDEDSHTVIETFVTDAVGDVGRKIHTGRSRNDQVLAALRLYLQDALSEIGRQVVSVAEKLCGLADRYPDTLLPGYTHLQRAMPSTIALWALGYAEIFADDLETLRQVRDAVNVSPLGSAAGYGVPVFDLPREEVAERLGFDGVQTHATAVQLARGKHELAVAHACTQLGATANRLASDLVLYASTEFDFVELPDEHCTGSSIMPQKKNPDVLELVRAYHHRLSSAMQSLATGPSNLPSGYHRDLQLTKGAVMRSLEIASDVCSALEEILDGLTFKPEQTTAAATPELLATRRALERVRDGIPFRRAYRQTATADPEGAMTSAEILGAYRTPGSPGNEEPDAVRNRLDEHDTWLTTDA